MSAEENTTLDIAKIAATLTFEQWNEIFSKADPTMLQNFT
jgi:aryl carrier-like protein